MFVITRGIREVDLLIQAAIRAKTRPEHVPIAEIVVAAHVVGMLWAEVLHLEDNAVRAVRVAVGLTVGVLCIKNK